MLKHLFLTAEATSALSSTEPVTRIQATIRQDARRQQANMTPEARQAAANANRRGALEANRPGRPTRNQNAFRQSATSQLPDRETYTTTQAQLNRVRRQGAGSGTRN